MAKIDVEVFTNEIEKTYTILKQNLIMIDTIKQLIAQGNLSEDAIASLNTALSTTNTKLDNLNTFTKQEFLRTNQKISTVETTQENMNNIIATDINTDSNGYLILEHDGVEITGQKKVVKIGKYNSDTRTFEFTDSVLITSDLEIDAYNYTFTLAKDNIRSLILSVDEFTQDYDIISFNVIYNDYIEKTISLTLPSQGDNNYILTNSDLYVHYLEFKAGETTFYGVVYSSNSNVTNTLQKLTTLLKPSSAQMFIPLTNDYTDCGVLYWNGSTWQVAYSGGGLDITSVSDRVKTI